MLPLFRESYAIQELTKMCFKNIASETVTKNKQRNKKRPKYVGLRFATLMFKINRILQINVQLPFLIPRSGISGVQKKTVTNLHFYIGSIYLQVRRALNLEDQYQNIFKIAKIKKIKYKKSMKQKTLNLKTCLHHISLVSFLV
jgi:hypothetical protein